ncbi:MAG: superoxide dismutase, partial [Candidatus Dadabacteria bacterium]
PEDKRTPVKNHAGGVWNHTFFWHCMKPQGGGDPVGKVADAIKAKWDSVEKFREAFSAKAASHFGSGWAWLVLNKEGELEITDSHDQESPISYGLKPLLTIDVWEHAYYLKYQNLRPKWIEAFWNIVNWERVNELYEAATR